MITLRDKVFGCYLGAAAGDALGGPVQAMHGRRIQRLFAGGVTDMLPYRKPPGFFRPGPGFAVHETPGSVTDETFIRSQFAHFAIDHEHSRTAIELVRHLVRYGDPKTWPPRMFEPLRRIQRNEAAPETAGQSVEPGEGLSWFVPIGIVNAGRPDKAASEAAQIAMIWKRPLERDFVMAAVAGIAHGLTPQATVDSVLKTACQAAGPLAKALILRAVELARTVPRGEIAAFVDRMYEGALVEKIGDEPHGAVPPPARPPENVDAPTVSRLLAEQVPLAFAALVFGDGRSRITLQAAASLGRDAKAIASMVGAWIGAVVGRSRLPREWVGAVIAANENELDLVHQANEMADVVEPRLTFD
jgi:ADP-ribosylglycohydrolase